MRHTSTVVSPPPPILIPKYGSRTWPVQKNPSKAEFADVGTLNSRADALKCSVLSWVVNLFQVYISHQPPCICSVVDLDASSSWPIMTDGEDWKFIISGSNYLNIKICFLLLFIYYILAIHFKLYIDQIPFGANLYHM